jgi:PPOX class probable F420-dependent enzyme
MLAWEWAVELLVAARNYWICTTRADGGPHAAPVWGLWHDDAVVFGTSPESAKGRNLRRDPRIVIHLESGDEVVIVEGTAAEVPFDDAILDAYEAKYDVRLGARGGYGVRPSVAYAWLESDYPRTATRFTW